ncbi:MAG: acyl-CoA synthetase [Pseudomonadota bacterium]|jgi:fatty-acyl-CoA synthase
MTDKFEEGLCRNRANFVPMCPASFLRRTAEIHPDRIAVIHGVRRYSYREFHERASRLASALSRMGVGVGDTVAIMAPNIPPMLEAHFAVPAIGAVLNPVNVRLDAETIAFILRHGEARVFVADREYAAVARAAMDKQDTKPALIEIDDAGIGEPLGGMEYESLLEEGDPAFPWRAPKDEWEAFCLSYTSGTTGDPKGVVYHHRGAYLNALANVAAWGMPRHPVYLWTLPIFHSLGWCFPWTVTLLAGTHVCVRRVEARAVFGAIAEHGVTHMCGAPVVLNLLIQAKPEERRPLPHQVQFMTAASAPPAAVLQKMEAMGFKMLHVYGMTEVYGPSSICEWKDEWDILDTETQANIKARQGVRYLCLEELAVLDPKTYQPVPRDGRTIGEVMKRGNTIMKGYLKNRNATAAAFDNDWFHSGDLAVMHPDGYIELKDRAKDIIISGGENISTIEVESVLYRHPAVAEAAVVARPDPHWGETPCAFVTLREGAQASAEEIIAFCRERMAHFKVPRTVVFGPLDKTSTGKIQKYLLRERARKIEASD